MLGRVEIATETVGTERESQSILSGGTSLTRIVPSRCSFAQVSLEERAAIRAPRSTLNSTWRSSPRNVRDSSGSYPLTPNRSRNSGDCSISTLAWNLPWEENTRLFVAQSKEPSFEPGVPTLTLTLSIAFLVFASRIRPEIASYRLRVKHGLFAG